MTEERFNFIEKNKLANFGLFRYYIFDTDYNKEVPIANIVCGYDDVDTIVGVLNEQQREINSLKEQLQNAYVYFKDYLEDEMSAENFGEMWEMVVIDGQYVRKE